MLAVLLVGCAALACSLWRHPVTADDRGRFLAAAATSPVPAACGQAAARCRQELALPGGATIAAYGNFPMAGSPAVTHALVVVHGDGRDPIATFTGMMAAADSSGVTAHTLVLAPWFKSSQDEPGAGEASWSSEGWKSGDGAVSPSGLSSFAVMDDLVATLADRTRFPRLSWVTVTGHSAGGQFTDRYATFGLGPNSLPGVLVTYVIANPSSFVYFDAARPDAARPDADATSSMTADASSCPAYDNYKYGLRGRRGYVAQLTPQQALTQFVSRRVTILSGAADTTQNGDMDASCAAMMEGPNRASRAANFFTRIHSVYPGAPHDRIVVPGTGHDHYALFGSPVASSVLFGPGHTPATGQ
jgi:hypothetical protein